MTLNKLKQNIVLGLMLTAVAFGAQAVEEVPVSDFFTHNLNSRPELSPSGRYLSVVTWDPKKRDRNLLMIYDLKDRSIRKTLSLKQTPPYGQEIFWNVYWLTDDHIVFESVRNTSELGQPRLTGKIYSINLEEDNLRLLQAPWRENFNWFQILRILPDDPDHIVTVSHSITNFLRFDRPPQPPNAYLLDSYGSANLDAAFRWGKGVTANGHRIMSSPLPNGVLAADRNGHIRFAAGSDPDTGKGLAVYRENLDAEWQPIPRHFLNQLGEEFVDFTADGEDFLTLSYDSGGGTLGLYRVDTETGEGTKLYSNPQADIIDDNTLIWGPQHKHVAAIQTMYGLPKLSLLRKDGSVAKVLSAFSQGFPGQFPQIASWSRDGSRAVVSVSSDRNPGRYFLVDVESMHAEPLFKRRPGINPKNMAPMRAIQFKARDGMLIHGYLTLPQGKSSDLPMIVYVHGGPHGIRDQWGFDSMVQFLANRGYAVLQINYRGSIGYGWEYTEAGFGHWGTTMQYDVIDGTRWAIKQGYADSDRVCIFGGSYGGYTAIRSAELAPDLYQCTVGYAGVYNLNIMFDVGDIKDRASGVRYMKMVLGEDSKVRAEQSPVNHVENLDGGILLIHGGKDRRAPKAHVEALMARLDAAGKSYQYLYKPDEAHGFADISNQREMARKLLEFFDTWTDSGSP